MAVLEDTVNIADGGGDVTLTVTLDSHEGGSTECDLHIPHPDAGAQLAKLIGTIPGVERGLLNAITRECERIDANFNAVEDWVTYYIRNCCCVESIDLSFTGGT